MRRMRKKSVLLVFFLLFLISAAEIKVRAAEHDSDAIGIGETAHSIEEETVQSVRDVPGTWIKNNQNGKWWYRHNDGSYTQNDWEKIDGKWYFFDSDGWMTTGWKKIGNGWYYFGDSNSGYMRTGWQTINNNRYYFGDDGTGYMRTGWRIINSQWYYFGGQDDGIMRTAWHYLTDSWYYFQDNGVMVNYPTTINGTHFTFYDNGRLLSTVLSVTRQKQQKSNWCWAASAVAIGKYRTNSNISQINAVTYVKGSDVNLGGTDTEFSSAVSYVSNGTKECTIRSPLTYKNATNYIDWDHPFGIHITWNTGGGHMLVCAGYNLKSRSIYAIDPWENTANSYYNYASLVNGTTLLTGTGRCTSIITYR